MLQPNKDRLDYGELLMPPEGYQLENAIATSYSLDLDALVSIPVALYLRPSLEVDLKKNVVEVLDSIRRASSTLRIFCQKGQIKVPDKQNRLYAFIEPCIVQIPPSHQHSFHPKVWVLRYRNSYKEVKYRVIVLSRNLTFDRSWDVAYALDGSVPQKRNSPRKRVNKPLISFVNYLVQHDATPWYKQFMDDLWRVEFELGTSPFESFEFVPLGIEKKEISFIEEEKLDDLLVISPFITKGGLSKVLRSFSGKPTLLSREEELRKIGVATLQKFDVWHLNPAFVQGEEKVETDMQENSGIQLQDLHAKVYSYKTGWNACLLLGSANCSERAMYRNVEFMIRLKGKNSKVGPGVIRRELLESDSHLFLKFDPIAVVEQEEDLQHEYEQELQRIRIELANAKLTAIAARQEDGNYQIEFIYDLSDLSGNVAIRCFLVNNADQSTILEMGKVNCWTIRNLQELDISSFLVLELTLTGSSVACRFALKVCIENLPASRSTRIFRDIISNTANFFRYLRFLLAESAWDEMHTFDEPTDGAEGAVNNKRQHSFALEEALYESMLKAASREPHKLSEIREVMERLSQEDDQQFPVIPEEFKALWHVFESIRREET